MSDFTAYVVSSARDTARVKLAGELDVASRELAEEALGRVEDKSSVVLDLSQVVFIDSMGIHFVVTAHERAQRDGRRLTIVRGGPEVTRVFGLVGLDDALPFADAA